MNGSRRLSIVEIMEMFDVEEEREVEGERPIERLGRFIGKMVEYGRVRSSRAFLEECGCGMAYIQTQRRKGGGVTSLALTRIMEKYPELNLAWLYTGRGRMTTDLTLLDVYKKELSAALSELARLKAALGGEGDAESILMGHETRMNALMMEENRKMKAALESGNAKGVLSSEAAVLRRIAETLEAICEEDKNGL